MCEFNVNLKEMIFNSSVSSQPQQKNSVLTFVFLRAYLREFYETLLDNVCREDLRCHTSFVDFNLSRSQRRRKWQNEDVDEKHAEKNIS